jgi:hypothetical protein
MATNFQEDLAMPTEYAPHSLCRLGLARVDITPPVGMYHRMWGAALQDRSTGVHRPLTATALVLESMDQPEEGAPLQVIVAVDHCLLPTQELNTLREVVCTSNQLPLEQLLVTFSHTHAAGLVGLDRVSFPGGDLIPSYLDHLGQQIAECVAQARRTAQPATIVYESGRCRLARNRDYWDHQREHFVCGYNPEGTADDTVLVARIHSDAGTLLGTVVNYACHPTTLAWDNTLISPDFPGALREVIEATTRAPCLFLQGASGDLGPREGFVGDPAIADRNGRQLAYSVLATLEGMSPPGMAFTYTGPVISGATLGTWGHQPVGEAKRAEGARWRLRHWTVDLPYREDLPTLERAEQQRSQLLEEERQARQVGDEETARRARALAERLTRWQTRLRFLPTGPKFPYAVTLLRMGESYWVGVEGEPYQDLQIELRKRAAYPVVVLALANGWRPSYLVRASDHGKGLYQESVAVLARGSLERLIEAIAQEMANLSVSDGARRSRKR